MVLYKFIVITVTGIKCWRILRNTHFVSGYEFLYHLVPHRISMQMLNKYTATFLYCLSFNEILCHTLGSIEVYILLGIEILCKASSSTGKPLKLFAIISF